MSPNLKITGLILLVYFMDLKEKMHPQGEWITPFHSSDQTLYFSDSKACLFDSLRNGYDTWYSVGFIINVYDF